MNTKVKPMKKRKVLVRVRPGFLSVDARPWHFIVGDKQGSRWLWHELTRDELSMLLAADVFDVRDQNGPIAPSLVTLAARPLPGARTLVVLKATP